MYRKIHSSVFDISFLFIFLLAFFTFLIPINVSAQENSKFFTEKSVSNILPGKTNEDIKFLQKTLYDFGYYKVEEDKPIFSGKFEIDLQNAIKDFQTTNDLKITGRADFTTLRTLNEFLKYKYANSTENTNLNENENISNNSNSVEGNYFSNEQDAVDIYSSNKSTASEYLEKDKEISEKENSKIASENSVIGGIINSLVSLFKPSGKYREEKVLEINMAYEEKLMRDADWKKNKFSKYDFFDCLNDDECIKFMNK